MNVKEMLLKRKLIAICRGVYGESLDRLADALFEGGFRFMEVTFPQAEPDCINLCAKAVSRLKRRGDMVIGAGTVLTEAQLAAAREAGAEFMVAPNTDVSLIRKAAELGMMTLPGAMTPSEAVAAFNAGADFVKLFPAGTLGLKYFRDLRAPLSHIPFIMTAGISKENLADFLAAGAAGAGISSPLCSKALIQAGDFEEIRRRAAELCGIADRF